MVIGDRRAATLVALIAAVLAACSSRGPTPLGGPSEGNDATIELIARLGVELSSDELDCVERRGAPPPDVPIPPEQIGLYGLVRCAPGTITPVFADRFRAARPDLTADAAACAAEASTATLLAATDEEIVAFVADDLLPSTVADELRPTLVGCGLDRASVDAILAP